MAKVKVYPSTRYSIGSDKPTASPKYCTRAYFELDLHNRQEPDYTRRRDVDEALLDGNGCTIGTKML